MFTPARSTCFLHEHVPCRDRRHQRARFCLDMCSVACMGCRVFSWHMAQSASERKEGEGTQPQATSAATVWLLPAALAVLAMEQCNGKNGLADGATVQFIGSCATRTTSERQVPPQEPCARQGQALCTCKPPPLVLQLSSAWGCVALHGHAHMVGRGCFSSDGFPTCRLDRPRHPGGDSLQGHVPIGVETLA